MYAELHCLSNFSFLRGASHPQELVARAAELGYAAISISDECSLAGIVKAHVAAKEHGIKLIVGSEFFLHEDLHLVLLAPTRNAYAELSTLISRARRRSDKGEYLLHLKDLKRGTRELLAIWHPQTNIKTNNSKEHGEHNNKQGQQLRTLFPDRLWLGFSSLADGCDHARYEQLRQLAESLHLPMLACGNVHMHCRERLPLQQTLTAIRLNTAVQKLGRQLHSNSERYLREPNTLQQCYPSELLQQTLAIAERCSFSMDELRYDYPQELVPPGLSPSQYLRQMVELGIEKRWPGGATPALLMQIEHELELIEELHYEYYFLTVFDIVAFARQQGILCQGRGSAANSVVCFCLFITEVDPSKVAVLFERFISKERNEPPDIDVDFEHERREEVIQYIYRKYSREHAALAATVITYRPRSAIRDVGKALGLDQLLVDQLAKSLAWWDRKAELAERFREANINNSSNMAQTFLQRIDEILGFPRHLSQHVGGFIITDSPISNLVPVENAAMPERTIIQWDKTDIEALGLLKVDVLALGMLSCIRKSFDLITSFHGVPIDMSKVPSEDPVTYERLCQGDSIGIFQVESRAQISMLPRLRPRCFYDLVIQVAIVRPGPIQGDMVHPYLRRRNGEEAVSYPNDEVKAVLSRTLGVPIFQEQVIKLAMVAAGFSGGEADQLRRAMASWGKNGNLMGFEQKVIDGMLARGHSLDFAQRLFRQMQGFGDYGFPESHAASFALLVYVSAWLKCHFPAAFYCALLNSQPMGFYSPSQLLQDAQRHGLEIRPIDVCCSDWDCSLEQGRQTQPALRLGLRLIKGFSVDAACRLQQARCEAAFQHIQDLASRARLNRHEMEALVTANALKALSGHRYQAQWESSAIEHRPGLHRQSRQELHDDIQLAAPDAVNEMLEDYRSTGLSLQHHPMSLLRNQEAFRRCRKASELPTLNHGRLVRVGGVVTGKQRPGSAAGVIFLTLEDETGNINVVIWKDLQQRCRQALMNAKLLLVKGVVECSESVIHVIAGDLIDQTHLLPALNSKSRDFH
jgi:error-prone DNA polymerase